MRRTAPARILALLLATGLLFAGCASYESGLAAYGRGDYKTALEQWQPLAEDGRADARHQLGRLYETG
ncbi:MAG TPA: hypothetical protein VF987_06800, partial [Rhodospirillales bacterium]